MKQTKTEIAPRGSKFVSKLVNDGTRYGSSNLEDIVSNELLGICRVKLIHELEDNGAIVYQEGYWKIKTEPIFVNSENKDRFGSHHHIGECVYVPTQAWNDWIESKKTSKVKQQIEEDKQAFEELVNMPQAQIF